MAGATFTYKAVDGSGIPSAGEIAADDSLRHAYLGF